MMRSHHPFDDSFSTVAAVLAPVALAATAVAAAAAAAAAGRVLVEAALSPVMAAVQSPRGPGQDLLMT